MEDGRKRTTYVQEVKVDICILNILIVMSPMNFDNVKNYYV